jgi:hypothetical protein
LNSLSLESTSLDSESFDSILPGGAQHTIPSPSTIRIPNESTSWKLTVSPSTPS